MSRRSHHTRHHSRRHSSHGVGAAGALVTILIFGFLLGGIGATTPVPDGVIGAAFVIVILMVWISVGTRRH
jgi:Na+/citrate or Na+/malate symporter